MGFNKSSGLSAAQNAYYNEMLKQSQEAKAEAEEERKESINNQRKQLLGRKGTFTLSEGENMDKVETNKQDYQNQYSSLQKQIDDLTKQKNSFTYQLIPSKRQKIDNQLSSLKNQLSNLTLGD